MKKILFIGDSIMYGVRGLPGYGEFVEQKLRDKAKVILPNDNCQDVRYTYDFLEELFDLENIRTADIVYWNNGLWDLLHFCGNPKPHTEIKLYLEFIEKLYLKINDLAKGAKIIFSTTTYIPEELQKTRSYRRNSEIAEYNQAVCKLLEKYNVAIHDLCEVAKTFGVEYRCADGLHFSKIGSEKLSNYVVSFINQYI